MWVVEILDEETGEYELWASFPADAMARAEELMGQAMEAEPGREFRLRLIPAAADENRLLPGNTPLHSPVTPRPPAAGGDPAPG